MKNTDNNGGHFYFKSAEHKKRINCETSYGYNLNVGNTLTAAEKAYVPTAGDLIYLRWSGVSSSINVSHVGFVRSVSGNTVYTVEGNAGKPACVRERSYSLSDSRIVGKLQCLSAVYPSSSQYVPGKVLESIVNAILSI